MGLHLPKRARRVGSWAALSTGLLLLGACSEADQDQIRRLAMPEPATDRAPMINDLWQGAWLAAILTGILVWGLIIYAVFRFRRRSDDEVPVQVRYNLPIEILYTVAPVVMVLVLFFFTVQTQNDVLAPASETGQPDHTVRVVGQQWSWSFNYMREDALGGGSVFTTGTPAQQPTLVLPLGESVNVRLSSPDVVHSFWVPVFLMKLDVIPGRDNSFSFTPTRTGTFAGRCAELCGAYHSRMLFNVRVVSPEQFDEHLLDLRNQGNVGTVLGGSDATEKAGLTNEVHEGDTTENGASQ